MSETFPRGATSDFAEFAHDTIITAPCCGRRVPAEMVHYVGHIPDALVDMFRIKGQNYACDSCREIWHREKLLKRSEYWRSHDLGTTYITRLSDRESAEAVKESGRFSGMTAVSDSSLPLSRTHTPTRTAGSVIDGLVPS